MQTASPRLLLGKFPFTVVIHVIPVHSIWPIHVHIPLVLRPDKLGAGCDKLSATSGIPERWSKAAGCPSDLPGPSTVGEMGQDLKLRQEQERAEPAIFSSRK